MCKKSPLQEFGESLQKVMDVYEELVIHINEAVKKHPDVMASITRIPEPTYCEVCEELSHGEARCPHCTIQKAKFDMQMYDEDPQRIKLIKKFIIDAGDLSD